MDLKQAGNPLYLVGSTQSELGGSHLFQVLGLRGGHVPQVMLERAQLTFECLHAAIQQGLVRACHDLSEGGLAVAAAEMSFAGQLGLAIDLTAAGQAGGLRVQELLFSESNSRFLVEVDAQRESQWQQLTAHVPVVRLGHVQSTPNMRVNFDENIVLDLPWTELFQAWHQPLDW
jgi:phosphoribosylformylglycinamidine synthase subunit PurSL